jgi:hypothetical protein
MTPERIIKGEKTSNQRRIMKFLKLGFEDLGIRVMDSRRDKSSKKCALGSYPGWHNNFPTMDYCWV